MIERFSTINRRYGGTYHRLPSPTMVEVNGIDVVALFLVLLPLLLLKIRIPQRTSILTGAQYFEELLQGHDRTFHEVARMDKPTFERLTDLLTTKWIEGI